MEGFVEDGLTEFVVDGASADDKAMARYYGSHTNKFIHNSILAAHVTKKVIKTLAKTLKKKRVYSYWFLIMQSARKGGFPIPISNGFSKL
ncbi:hypothetical protein Pyn_31094 [Prunus yedoensis var. nudiflora]|uniref:Uncharacterized protein n=1 Tax=Prunus yedoensis var. nudiflora TaxID=2094558 RepID=A0A314XMX7_PRUYE|nr:hypothetical protein Pyn_31094 [Prunus yedoensis var. nudiflora]